MIYENEFLEKLFKDRKREMYAKITSLDINEQPRESLEGLITQGSLNLDGNSSMRRSCSLSFSTPVEAVITSYYWALTSKFRLEIGLKNTIDSNYPEICYFPQGVFIIDSFSLSKSSGSYSISIQGKDKMCLLNGNVSGEIFAQTDFGTEEFLERTEEKYEDLMNNEIDEIQEKYEAKAESVENLLGYTEGTTLSLDSGEMIAYDNKFYITSDFISVTPGSIVTYKVAPTDGATGKHGICCYDKDKNFNGVIYHAGTGGTNIDVDLGENTYYVRANFLINHIPLSLENKEDGKILFNTRIAISNEQKITEILKIASEKFNKIYLTKIKYSNLIKENGEYKYTYTRSLKDLEIEQILRESVHNYAKEPYQNIIIKDIPKYGMFAMKFIGGTGGNLEGDDYIKDKLYAFIEVQKTTDTFEQGIFTDLVDYNNVSTVKYGGTKEVTELDLSSTDYNSIQRELIKIVLLGMKAIYKQRNEKIDKLNDKYPESISDEIEKPQEYIDELAEIEKKAREEIDKCLKNNRDKVSYYNYAGSDEKIEITDEEVEKIAENYIDICESADLYVQKYVQSVDITIPKQKVIVDDIIYNIGEQNFNVNDEDAKLKATTENGEEVELPFIFYNNKNEIEGGESDKANRYIQTLVYDKPCVVMKVNKGDVCGFKLTTLTYPRDVNQENSGLTIGVGENLCSMLDKIVQMLGNYEYFYNEYGQFVFQRKNGFLDSSWKINEFEGNSVTGVVDMFATPQNFWSFEDGDLVTSYNNTPNIGNIKNDFAIWGENDNELPIHMRYAIDRKPTRYVTVYVTQEEVDGYKRIHPEFEDMKPQNSVVYITADYTGAAPKGAKLVDWRELIYQMSCDYLKYNHFDTFNNKIEEANNYYDEDNNYIVPYPAGITGYEQYYVDLNGFWRQIYVPYDGVSLEKGFTESGWSEKKINNPESLIFWFDFLDSPGSEIDKMNVKNIMDRSKSVSESEIKAIYYRNNLNLFYLLNDGGNPNYEEDGYREPEVSLISNEDNEDYIKNLTLSGKIDDSVLLETVEEMESAAQNTYIVTPSVKDETKNEYKQRKFIESLAEQRRLVPYIESAYSKYTYIDNKEANYFQLSNTGKSCKDVLDEYLYNYTYATETVSLSIVPVYHLQPGDIIMLNDKEAMLEGKYVINSISIPLSYNGTMSLNVTKVIESLY